MATSRIRFVGPRLRKLRRELGRTQAQMAADLQVSGSYIALIERNQRPITAELLLRLAEAYRIDVTALAAEDGEQAARRLEDVFRDPLLADLDPPQGDLAEAAMAHPALAEAVIRLHTAQREAQLALAHRGEGAAGLSPLEETRLFLATHGNYFPVIDERAERIARAAEAAGGLSPYFEENFGYRVRRLPTDIMGGDVRRLDRHRSELHLDQTLDQASHTFQLAMQIVYLDLSKNLEAALRRGSFTNDGARALARRALANYAAGAILMPYGSFYRAAERTGYDVEAIGRQFATSFEQTAHRLCTLRKPGLQGVPFFFIRVDVAGNVSKRFDGGGFPFARHGGSCPLWSLHHTFSRPREVVTEILELPDGERFFSVARTVTAGGGTWDAQRVTRAVALGCSIKDADRLVYAKGRELRSAPATPIGITCRLCQRADCNARAEPPIGRPLLPDDYRRVTAPFAFGEG